MFYQSDSLKNLDDPSNFEVKITKRPMSERLLSDW